MTISQFGYLASSVTKPYFTSPRLVERRVTSSISSFTKFIYTDLEDWRTLYVIIESEPYQVYTYRLGSFEQVSSSLTQFIYTDLAAWNKYHQIIYKHDSREWVPEALAQRRHL